LFILLKMKMIKLLKRILITLPFILLNICKLSAQTDTSLKNKFSLTYLIAGLGSGMGSFLPVFRLSDNKYILTREQNSYYENEKNNRVDTVQLGFFRESSIDSIKNVLIGLKDTTIYKTNPCIMSGGIYLLTIVQNNDTVTFELHNTFDYTALKVANIINTYLPEDEKIGGDEEEEIKREAECWKLLLKRKVNHKKLKHNNKRKTQ